MKNLKKFLPLFAFVLGLGLVFTQSAFKSVDKQLTKEWGFDENLGVWVDLNDLPIDATGTTCDEITLDPCTYIFNDTIDPNEEVDPISMAESDGAHEGKFRVTY